MLKLQNHELVKEPFEVQDKPMNFNVVKYKKSTDIFRLHNATNLRNYHLLSFGELSKISTSEKAKYSSFSNNMC